MPPIPDEQLAAIKAGLEGGRPLPDSATVLAMLARIEVAEDRVKAQAFVIECAERARVRLHEYSLLAQAGKIDACGREFERRVWATFSDFVAARAALEGK